MRWVSTQRGSLLMVGLVSGFALGLRLWNLDTEPMHVDELLQASHVQAPWGDLVGLAYRFQATPVDYVIGKLVVTVAPATDFVQRFPSVVFGAGSIALVGILLVRAGHRLAGVLAAFLMAVSPFLVSMSQFARPYALPVFLVALMLAVHQHWERGSKTRGTLGLFVVVGALAIISRPVMPLLALITFGGLALAAGLKRYGLDPRALLRADPLALGVLPGLFGLVWLPNALVMRAAGGGGWLVDCWHCDKWDRVANGVERFGEFGEAVMRPLSLNLLLVIGVLILAFPSVRRDLGSTRLIWAPLLAVGPAFALYHALILAPDAFFAERYLVFLPAGLSTYFAVAIGALVGSSRRLRSLVRTALLAGIVGVVLVAVSAMLGTVSAQAQNTYLADWRSTADHIEAVEADDDLIVTIDTRPFKDEFRFSFNIAAGRYYGGSLTHVTPDDLISSPEGALDAGRYHFVLFVPKMKEDWEFGESWVVTRFSGMLVVTTPQLQGPLERLDAWWELTQQLRPDVAIRSQITGAALQSEMGLDAHPWLEIAREEARRLGQTAFAESLIAIALDG